MGGYDGVRTGMERVACVKKTILEEVTISCDPPNWYGWRMYGGDKVNEQYAKYCEEWVKDFHDFIRDHRSQDPVGLNVDRHYKTICEFCEYEWEEDIVSGQPLCCTEAISEWEKETGKVASL